MQTFYRGQHVQAWAELLKAIAALMWPVFAFVTLFTFRVEIRSILKRLRKGKVLGQELELQESLGQLEASATAALAEVEAQTTPELPTPGPRAESADEVVRDILKEAGESPRAGLLLLSAEIERALREILQSNGWAPPGRPLPFSRSLELLAARANLPPALLEATRYFHRVRNQLAHGMAASDADVLRAVDAGTEIYHVLTSLPHATHTLPGLFDGKPSD